MTNETNKYPGYIKKDLRIKEYYEKMKIASLKTLNG